jgi:putative hemolysin
LRSTIAPAVPATIVREVSPNEVDAMQGVSLETLVILGLILLNGLLAMSRTSIEAARKSQLNDWSSQGNRAASAALLLRNDPRGLEWTVQLVATLLTVAVGVYAGNYLVPALGLVIGGPGGLAARAQIAIFWIVIVAVTVASILFSEMMPRRLALLRPERTAGLLALPVRGI